MRRNFENAVAQWFVDDNNGLIDMDKAYVLANELWDKAAHGNKLAQKKLGILARKYQKGELA